MLETIETLKALMLAFGGFGLAYAGGKWVLEVLHHYKWL